MRRVARLVGPLIVALLLFAGSPALRAGAQDTVTEQAIFFAASVSSPSTRAAQSATPSLGMPATVPLSEIEMTLEHRVSGGCLGRCVAYRVVVRGPGIVDYRDFGGEPRPPDRQRTISGDEFVSILNAFVGARFFDAAASYTTAPQVRRDGEMVRFDARAGVDGPEWDLTLRVGSQVKSVHLYMGFPSELAALRDLLDRVGGPGAWTQ